LAKGYKDGKDVIESKVETTGEPVSVQLKPNQEKIYANGQDVAVFTVSIADAQGRVSPVAGNKVAFTLEGPGRIIGVGNGDPSSHEADTFIAADTSRSVPVGGWRWKKLKDVSQDNLPEEGAEFDDASWAAVDVGADMGQLGYRERAIYRAHFSVDARDLASRAVELVFGRIIGGNSIYVNGHKVGASIDGRVPAIFDVKALLHPGENVVALPASSYGADPTGMSKGVSLRLQDAGAAVHWERSAFNGLAEIIVQASKEPGTITLTASSGGLKPASFELKSAVGPAWPTVP
jgi:beta-galactosidase